MSIKKELPKEYSWKGMENYTIKSIIVAKDTSLSFHFIQRFIKPNHFPQIDTTYFEFLLL